MEIKLSEEALQHLINRATAMSNVLAKWEIELERLDPSKMSSEDVVKMYGQMAKQQMELLEFTRKMMLLPQDNERNKKVQALVDRLLALSESKLVVFEDELKKIEQIRD